MGIHQRRDLVDHQPPPDSLLHVVSAQARSHLTLDVIRDPVWTMNVKQAGGHFPLPYRILRHDDINSQKYLDIQSAGECAGSDAHPTDARRGANDGNDTFFPYVRGVSVKVLTGDLAIKKLTFRRERRGADGVRPIYSAHLAPHRRGLFRCRAVDRSASKNDRHREQQRFRLGA